MKQLPLVPALLAVACAERAEGARVAPAVPVLVAAAVEKTVPIEIRAIGRAQPRSTVSILPQVSGQILAAHFTEGRDVKKGDLLFTIDARPYEAELRLAEADQARDDARFSQAESDLKRSELAAKSGALSAERVEHARADVAALRAAAAADAARAESARLKVEYCSVRAPMEGRTGALTVFPGAVVKENEAPALVVLNQIRPIDVAFSVAETFLPDVRRYRAAGTLAVDVTIPEVPDPPLAGTLTFIDNGVDMTTGTIRLKATFPNEDGRLWPGQFVEVRLRLTEQQGAVVVPSEAIRKGQSGSFLFVILPDLTAEARSVEIGRTIGAETVVTKGVRAGERVVRDGHLALVTGSRVEVKAGLTGGAESRP